MVLTALGMLLFARMPVHGSYVTDVLPGMGLASLGMGAVFMPVTVASVSTIPKEDMGQASTLNSVISQFSMALAPALVATLLIADTPAGAHTAPPSAYRTVYLVLAVMALVAPLFTLTIHDPGKSRALRTPQGPRVPKQRETTARRPAPWSGP